MGIGPVCTPCTIGLSSWSASSYSMPERHRLREGPKTESVPPEPMANSSRLVLPRTTAPARSRLDTTEAE